MEAPFFVTFAEHTLNELRLLFESQPSFKPVLFLHLTHQDDPVSPGPIKILPLDVYEQESWPEIIRHKAQEADTEYWSVATEVSMRFRASSPDGDPLVKVEEWLVYLVSFQGGMMIWGAQVKKNRKLGPMQDLTGDPRVQKMMAHLSEANGSMLN